MDSNCVAIVSGGLDSTTLVYDLASRGHRPYMLSFNYGQRHVKELEYACMTACKLNLEYYQVDLSSITALISNSALTSSAAVPEGHYAEDSMKQTIVPNRNMIMASVAIGLAVSKELQFVATGVHAGDHWVYPDCRPEFVKLLSQTALVANEGLHRFQHNPHPQSGAAPDGLGPIFAPYLYKSKADIAYRALELDVPLADTWSCLTGDTEVVTLNGAKPIVDVRPGEWVWGYTENGWTPALVEDFMIQGIKPVYEVTIKDAIGKITSFRATGDHLLMMRDGSYRRVDQVSANASLMQSSIYTMTVGKSKKQYLAVKPHNSWKEKTDYLHRVAGRFFGLDVEGKVVHHRNGDTFDNRPGNLQGLLRGDHSRLTDPHRLSGTPKSWAARAEGVRRHWESMTTEEYQARCEAIARGRNEQLNHRVVSVRPVGEDMTYDIQTSTRNFAIGAGIFVHNCYKGGEVHCGRCGTCVERLEAVAEAQQRFASRTSHILRDFQPVDATEYADTEYWKTAAK